MINRIQVVNRVKIHFQKNHSIWLIVSIAFVLRFLLFIMGDGFTDTKSTVTRPDSRIYISSAKSIATTGEFNSSPTSSIPETKRPVGYPFYLALLFLIDDGLILAVLVTCLSILVTSTERTTKNPNSNEVITKILRILVLCGILTPHLGVVGHSTNSCV